MNSSTVLVGFGRGLLNAALLVDRPVREDIEINAVYFRQGGAACCWIVLDCMDFDLAAINRIKGTAAEACRLPPEHVHVLTTHNHGVGGVEALNVGLIAGKAAEIVKAAAGAAAPGYMRFAQVTIAEQLNYVRRLHVEEFGGATTLFFGPCAANGFDSSAFLRHQIYMLREKQEIHYSGQSETASRLIPALHPQDDTRVLPADPLAALLLFEREDGAPIGSVCRFAAHAVCCNRPEYYSSDYPYYVRKTLREKLGGEAIFMNGPCAEIAPAIPDKISGEERRLGCLVGTAAARAIAGIYPVPLNRLEDYTREIILPVRADLAASAAEDNALANAQETIARAANRPLPEIKKIAEKLRFAQTADFLRRKWLNGESPELVQRRKIKARLGCLKLNDIHILAFPGETFSATAARVRAQCGLANVITVTEHDRTLMYLPPPEEFVRSGYETNCCLIAPSAEPILQAGALAMLIS